MSFDPRGLNNMTEETLEIHGRLIAWADWSRDRSDAGQGMGSRSIIAKLMAEGPGAAHQGATPVTMPDAILAVDFAVTRLPRLDRRVIIGVYRGHEPFEAIARDLNMDAGYVKGLLFRRARWHVRGSVLAMDYVFSLLRGEAVRQLRDIHA
jgi:hypothetical protein